MEREKEMLSIAPLPYKFGKNEKKWRKKKILFLMKRTYMIVYLKNKYVRDKN